MDKESLQSVAPLGAAVLAVIAGLIAICVCPAQTETIKGFVGNVLMICAAAWQPRPQKQPGA